jgi:hypothetical protein
MSVTSATNFPSPTGVQYFYCTLADAATQTTIEIVKVTSVSGTTFSITRAQDGTSATAFSAGAVVSLRLVRASLNDFPKLDETNTFNADQAITGQLTTSAGIATTGQFTATAPSNGVVTDLISGFGRFSTFSSNGFQWFTGGIGTTKLMQLSSSGQLYNYSTSVVGGSLFKGTANTSSLYGVYDSPTSGNTNYVLLGIDTTGGSVGYSAGGVFVSTGANGTGTSRDLIHHVYGANNIIFATNNTERARIFASGGVSIGNTTDPGATNLSVTGKAIIQGLTVGTGGGSGTANTVVGNGAANSFSSSSYNAIFGYQAGYSSSSNNYCTLLGWQAGYNVTGNANICIGAGTGASLTTGINNIHFGYTAASSGSASSELVIGSSNTLITGKGTNTGFIAVYNSGYGSIYQGNNSASWATISDQRLKKNIVDNNTGLEIISKIQVRNFEYRLPEEVDSELNPSDAILKTGTQLGVIAQEIAQVSKEFVKTESTGVICVDTDNLTWYLVNAVKELKEELDGLKQQLGK